MKKFLFITHLTPKHKRSTLRNDLIAIMESSLRAQTYTNWKALWIGEQETNDTQVQEVALEGTSSEERESNLEKIFDRAGIRKLIAEADYLLKLDDDDIISQDTLKKVSTLDFDCYCDKLHTFYDLSSGSITQQKRPWIASTAIHKKEHALTNPATGKPSENLYRSLFYTDHSAEWIKYYRDKKLMFSEAPAPLYLRILSPTSITAGATQKVIATFKDADMPAYYQYLRSFGAWNKAKVSGFDEYLKPLSLAWRNFSGMEQKPVQGISYREKFKDYIRTYIK